MDIDIDSDPFSLSYGQKKLLSIYNILSISPKIILLDEPTAGLDKKNKELVINEIINMKSFRATVVIVSHDDKMLKILSERLIMVNMGRIIQNIYL